METYAINTPSSFRTITRVFEHQVTQAPHKTVVFEEGIISYQLLNEQVNRLAAYPLAEACGNTYYYDRSYTRAFLHDSLLEPPMFNKKRIMPYLRYRVVLQAEASTAIQSQPV